MLAILVYAGDKLSGCKCSEAAISLSASQKGFSKVIEVLRVPITKDLFATGDLTLVGQLTADSPYRAAPQSLSLPRVEIRAPSVRVLRPRSGCDIRIRHRALAAWP